MMSAILVPILAAAITVPQPQDRLFEAIIRSLPARGGEVDLEVFVAPDGEVLECRNLLSRPSEEVGERACERAIGRRTFKPALGPDGEPTHGLNWFMLSTSRRADYGRPADLVINVQSLPGGGSQQILALIVMVDTSGAVTHCENTDSERQALARIACEQAEAHRWTVRKGKGGEPVSYSAAVKIAFVEG